MNIALHPANKQLFARAFEDTSVNNASSGSNRPQARLSALKLPSSGGAIPARRVCCRNKKEGLLVKPATRTTVFCALLLTLNALPLAAQRSVYTKAQVGDLIRRVEDGVDQFRDYLDKRGDETKSRAEEAQNKGATRGRRQADPSKAQSRQDQAKRTKDDLDDALDDLNRSTNRLRRKFDPTPDYLQTRAEMERVMDSARRVNSVMTRGNYGTQAERYWAPLRTGINDLARTYGISPMGV